MKLSRSIIISFHLTRSQNQLHQYPKIPLNEKLQNSKKQPKRNEFNEFLDVRELQAYIQENKTRPKPQEKIINGYRVKVKYSETDPQSMKEAQNTIAKTILENFKKKKYLIK